MVKPKITRYEEGLASYREKCVMDVLLREGPTLSKDLKRLAGFGGGGRTTTISIPWDFDPVPSTYPA